MLARVFAGQIHRSGASRQKRPENVTRDFYGLRKDPESGLRVENDPKTFRFHARAKTKSHHHLCVSLSF